MKQNLPDKAFVAFVCLVGKPLLPTLCASWWESCSTRTNCKHQPRIT